MSYPRITVVTPSYNQAEFLRTAIVSVVSQKYPNLEYIIIDGGSTDGSVEIIREYAPQLTYWVSEKDNGQSEAIAKGFARATGDLLCWLNSDDVLFPGSLVAVARTYLQLGRPDVVMGNVMYIDENGHVMRCVRTPRQSVYLGQHGVLFLQAPAIFFQRKMYEQVGGLNLGLHYSMDNDLWFRFIKMGARFGHVPKYLGAFRYHTSSKTVAFRRGTSDAFEHPESRQIRERLWPGLTTRRVRRARIEAKLWRLVRLDYLSGWLDLQKWKGQDWRQVVEQIC